MENLENFMKKFDVNGALMRNIEEELGIVGLVSYPINGAELTPEEFKEVFKIIEEHCKGKDYSVEFSCDLPSNASIDVPAKYGDKIYYVIFRKKGDN